MIAKYLELRFRRLLLRAFRVLIKRKQALPHNVDYNRSKFLFLRQDLIGDALVSTPVFAILKHRFPDATLDILMSPKNHFILERDASIRTRWLYTKEVVDSLKLLRTLRREQYDFVVDLMDNPSTTSAFLCMIVGARWSVGLQNGNEAVYDLVAPMAAKNAAHIVERTAGVLSAFGIRVRSEDLRVRYSIASDAERFADDFWSNHFGGREPVLGVNISAGEELRSWWRTSCREFLRALDARREGWKILLLATPNDSAKVKAINNALQRDYLAATTPTFDHVAALIKRLDYLVTPDTSIVQLAGAFSIPAVVLHTRTSSLHGHLWTPYGSESENLVATVDDVDTIPFTDVLRAFDALVVRTKKSVSA